MYMSFSTHVIAADHFLYSSVLQIHKNMQKNSINCLFFLIALYYQNVEKKIFLFILEFLLIFYFLQ